MRTRLRGEDAAWLHMDAPTNPMVVSGIFELADTLSDERIHELLGRLTAYAPFASRVVEPRLHVGVPSWEPVAALDLDAHVERVRLEATSDADLRDFVSRRVSSPLDPERPLWRMHAVDRPGRGTLLLFRVHHAIADGYALLDVLHGVSGAPSAERPARPAPPRPKHGEALLRSARSLARLLALPPDPTTGLHAPLSGEKRVAWSRPIPLADVKRIGGMRGATVNDVLVAIVAGALRRHLLRRPQASDGRDVHAMVPVDLRSHEGEADLSNRFGLVLLALPVGVADPLARISAVHARMLALRESGEAGLVRRLLALVGHAPRSLEDAIATYFGTKTSLVLTNLIGPRERTTLAGVPIDRMMFWVPEAAHLGLGISIFSYARSVTIGALSDTAILEDPEILMTDIETELDVVTALSCG